MIGKITAISCHLESLDHWMNWVALAKNLQVRPLSNRFILVIDFHHARRLVWTRRSIRSENLPCLAHRNTRSG